MPLPRMSNKMYHISLLWQCWALSVERWEQFTTRAFPWKFLSQGFFSLSMSMKGVLQNKKHSIWLRNYSSVHDLILEARWVQRKSTSYYYRSSDSWQLHLRVHKAAQILQRANATKFQQFSSCSKSIAKPSVAFRNTSAWINKQINTAVNERESLYNSPYPG